MSIKPEMMPKNFLPFFHYFKNLNSKEEIKFSYWKAELRKEFNLEDLKKPYQWNNREGVVELIDSMLKSGKIKKSGAISALGKTFRSIKSEKENLMSV